MTLTFHRSGEKFDFEDWRVAFEVDLKMGDHSALAGIGPEWQAAFENSPVFKRYGKTEGMNFKHIYLDLQSTYFPLAYLVPSDCLF